MSKVKVTLVRSTINRNAVHRKTVRALGLRRLQQSRVHELSPSVRGMINQVRYMLKVEETGE
ncbi:50S ribosomal protein L30 [Candidatus Sumerlaeota bacterium]|nr:50S ribosomal protein L30 [Candidatus Sumerlaeota bacterium]